MNDYELGKEMQRIMQRLEYLELEVQTMQMQNDQPKENAQKR